jgi:hypothetical protein
MGETIEAWSRRAGLARRLAADLHCEDAEALTRFAEDCELRVGCLSRASAIHPCRECPLGREQPC